MRTTSVGRYALRLTFGQHINMADEDSFKAGDVCVDCQQLGIVKYLRYFKINLNGDTLLKCESNECMYPYNDEFSSTDEEEADEETNSMKFIDDLLQQIKNETADQNSINSSSENPAAETSNSFTATGSPDRVITRSATCLALLGIALSSFSLKQMLASSSSKSSRVPFRRF
ncbi:hypothetical protein DOY81_010703 [Sarcophaga bullata]|nr:hypothetical protein DOY81_010703 [Sarcophaga bullata]